MGFWISQEDLDGGARIDYDQEFVTPPLTLGVR
jgi:hypothetical protein